MNVRNKPVHSNFKQHHQSTTHILTHLWIIISGKMKEILEYKAISLLSISTTPSGLM